MADEWRDLHTFSTNEVIVASYFEDMRENYQYIRAPRYAVERAKLVTPTSVTLASGVVTSAWTQLSTTYLDPVTLVTSGNRDVLLASNPTGNVNNASNNIVFGFNWDDVPVYSNAEGLGVIRFATGTSFDLTIPIFTVIPAPTASEHTLKLYWKATNLASGTSSMLVTPKLFLLAMEI